MADITMCMNSQCPNALHCKRVQANAGMWQSWSMFQYTISDRGVECEHYYPMYTATTSDNTVTNSG